MIKEFNYISDPVVLHIWASLHHYDYDNALFAAERLYAETKCDESLYVLATCFYRQGRPKQAHNLLKTKGCFTSKCRYLLARCSWDIGLTSEAEMALVGPLCTSKSVEEIANEYGEQACYALLLLGDIFRFTDRLKRAAECYRQCLLINPLMWSAFEHLCDMGESVNPISIFQCPDGMILSTPTLTVTNAHTGSHLLKQCPQDNDDCQDTITIRENLNPTLKEVPFQSDNTASSFTSTTCSVNETFSLSKSSPTDCNDQYTPEYKGTAPVCLTAPKVLRTKKKTGRFLFSLEGDSPTSQMDASFGHLSLNYQSPMFASVPVFTSVRCSISSSISQENIMNDLVAKKIRGRCNIAAISPTKLCKERNHSRLENNSSVRRSSNTTPGVLQPGAGNRSDPPVLRSSHRSSQHPNTNQSTPLSSGNGNSSNLLNSPGALNTSDDETPPPHSLYLTPPASTFSHSGSHCNSSRHLSAKENTNASSTGAVRDASGPRTRAQAARAAAQKRAKPNAKEDVIPQKETALQSPNSQFKPSNFLGKPLNSSQLKNQLGTNPCDLRRQSLDVYLHLLQDLGNAYYKLSSFECNDALNILDCLSPAQYYSGLVLSWIARVYIELADYQSASRYFCELRQLEPWQLRGMDLYSTTLWQLAKDISLSALAGDLLELDRNAAEPWCAAGNCFSLQREHDVAIKYFKRALQVNPRFFYAYTLLGHEYMAMEDLDKALTAYRNSVRLNHRHYNAWFGISNVYFKQEKYSFSEIHLLKAVNIFPSTVLLTNLGAVRAKLGRIDGRDGALSCLDRACELSPRNPRCKYHRASVLVLLERHNEALKELEEVRQLAPKESMIYYLLGRVHKKLGNVPQAMIYFSWAMDLDPKGANSQIKDILNTRNPVDDALMDGDDLNADESIRYDDLDTIEDMQESGTFESL